MTIIHIIRGLPGSGKSTWAKEVASRVKCNHYEAYMYFVDADGNYKFNPRQIVDAHQWCYDQARRDLLDYKSVVISNTFTQFKEIESYVGLAQEIYLLREAGMYKGIHPMFNIQDMTENYGSIHGVPAHTMEKMKARWEPMQQIHAKIKQMYPHIGSRYYGQEIH